MHRHTQPRNPRRRETATGWSCKQQVWQDWQTANEPPLYHTNTRTLMPTQLAVCATTASPARHRAPHFLMWGIVCIFMCVCAWVQWSAGIFRVETEARVSLTFKGETEVPWDYGVCVCVSDGGIKWASQAAVSMCAAQLGVSSSGRRSEKSKWQGLYSPW